MHQDDFDSFLDDLNRSGKLILVEGKKDVEGLRHIGVENEIISFSGRSHYQIIEEIVSKTKNVIILTDFDKEGKKLYGRFNRGVARFGVNVDKYFREWLYFNTRISHIESIENIYHKL